MAYLEVTSLHALPADPHRTPEAASILFPRGPDWSRRYQRNSKFDYLDNRFMYKDQGPPLYRLLGHHYNMYSIPPRTDHHNFARSFHYEPRQYNAPNYRNGALTFPTGPAPAQVAILEGLKPLPARDPKVANLEMPGRTAKSLKGWDKYRYLPGPPHEAELYGRPQGWQTLPSN